MNQEEKDRIYALLDMIKENNESDGSKKMTSTQEKLNNIANWLEDNYGQDTENHDVFLGAKPTVVRYDEHTAISTWACGAIVCIGSILYFIGEDDGNWFVDEDNEGWSAFQPPFSIAWAKSFTSAMKALDDYVRENGKPVCYSGTDRICNYTL